MFVATAWSCICSGKIDPSGHTRSIGRPIAFPSEKSTRFTLNSGKAEPFPVRSKGAALGNRQVIRPGELESSTFATQTAMACSFTDRFELPGC